MRALRAPGSEKAQEYDTSRYDYGEMVVMEYPGLRIRLVGGVHHRGPFRVLEIEASEPLWTSTPGLYVGMPIEEAMRRLPRLKKGTNAMRPGQKLLIYAFPVAGTQAGGQLLLQVDLKKVVQITLTSDLDY